MGNTTRLKRVGQTLPPFFDHRLDRAVSRVQGEESEFHDLTALELTYADPAGWELVPLAQTSAPAIALPPPTEEKKE